MPLSRVVDPGDLKLDVLVDSVAAIIVLVVGNDEECAVVIATDADRNRLRHHLIGLCSTDASKTRLRPRVLSSPKRTRFILPSSMLFVGSKPSGSHTAPRWTGPNPLSPENEANPSPRATEIMTEICQTIVFPAVVAKIPLPASHPVPSRPAQAGRPTPGPDRPPGSTPRIMRGTPDGHARAVKYRNSAQFKLSNCAV